MQRERLSENVYWFQSDIYAQVTAGAITGPQWAVVIDTLTIPEETKQMQQFIEDELGIPVRYVINSHHHADHTWGNCFYRHATVIGHTLNRELTLSRGQAALEAARASNKIFAEVEIVAPDLTFDSGQMNLKVGKKTLTILLTPGHSVDGISVLIDEDKILFAGDTFMALPYIVDGDPEVLSESIRAIGKMGLENIVQGHGDIILRGEIEAAVKENLDYLTNIRKAVKTSLRRKEPQDYLDGIDIEACGKSRVNLGGLALELHKRNLVSLYRHMSVASND